ncbi:MAG: DNA-deoxyinosine glycosylase [Candidatus Coproplasma sp.]
MGQVFCGFQPYFNSDSKVLILGSFPSVKSRQTDFYYGNPQNRFWKYLSEFFSLPLPDGVEEKKSLLDRCKVALWDIVTECEIRGSSDATIKNYKVADLNRVLDHADVQRILINGGTAYGIFLKHYGDIKIPYVKLPSTSPANTRCDKEIWFNELRPAFGRTER